MKKEAYQILVLYHARGTYPLRHSVHSHLYCWKEHLKSQVIYSNVAFNIHLKLLHSHRFDAIIFDTSYMAMRWRDRQKFLNEKFIHKIEKSKAIKIIIPQDEFAYGDLISEFCNKAKIDLILSCANTVDQSRIYKNIVSNQLTIKRVLAGYLNNSTVKKVKKLYKPETQKKYDVSYRASSPPYWLGEHALLKMKIAEVFKAKCTTLKYCQDISTKEVDVISGNKWFNFLANTRAVIGVEGGASVLDLDGSIKTKVEKFMIANPLANFEECRRSCFKNEENTLSLFCISPRHLEAAMMKTCQILVEGEYNGILSPDVDYIPIKKDFSNIEEALIKINDKDYVNKLTENAYANVVLSGSYNYEKFVREIEGYIINLIKKKDNSQKNIFSHSIISRTVFKIKDLLNWQIIRIESYYLKKPSLFKPFKIILKPLYLLFVKNNR